MVIRELRNGEERDVQRVCQEAFSGFPWFLAMTDEYISNRWNSCSKHSGFHCVVAEIDGSIVGACWFCEMGNEEIEAEKGKALRGFAEAYQISCPRIWIDATVVNPRFQGQGLAKAIKMWILELIRSSHPQALLLTRMRDDNVGIIRINEEVGFRRTGIRIPATGSVHLHEYWYLAI